MRTRLNCSALALTLSWLLLPLVGCSSASPPYSPPPEIVRPPAIPRLPPAARQPTTPPECSPTCSAAASSAFDAWLQSPTSAAPPELRASGPTTR